MTYKRETLVTVDDVIEMRVVALDGAPVLVERVDDEVEGAFDRVIGPAPRVEVGLDLDRFLDGLLV